MHHLIAYKRKATKRRAIIGALGLLLVVLVVAAACGEDATPTPVPATATPVPPTATSVAQATATPAAPTTTLRDRSEWTVDNPATLAEIEAELEQHRGESFVFNSAGGAFQAAQRRAHLIPFKEKFGIDIIEESDPAAVAKTRAMSQTGNIQWDVVSLGQQSVW